MAIKRNAETGAHFIQTAKAKERGKRERYEKAPLVRERGELISFLAGIFDGAPNPFVGSPIAAQIDRRLRLRRYAKRAARANSPLHRGSSLVSAVSDNLRRDAIAGYDKADTHLDTIDTYLRTEKGWLEECRPSEIIADLKSDLGKLVAQTPARLSKQAAETVRKKIRLEQFIHNHNLDDSVHWGKKTDLAVFGQIGSLLVIEFIANSVFQADTQSTGLIGGVLVAVLTSLATIILGVMFGFGYQRLRRTSEGGGWIGIILLVLAALLSFIFVSSLSLVRLAGEAGDLNPLQTARMALTQNPLAGVEAMLDLPAFAYTLCIVVLIALVARKYLEYSGTYPGYRKRMLDFLNEEAAFNEDYHDIVDDANEIVERENEKLDEAPYFITSCKVPIRGLVMDHDNVVEQFHHTMSDIRGAGRLFDSYLNEIGNLEADARVRALEDETLALIDGNSTKLIGRNAEFRIEADELCSREDFSQETVDAAKIELDGIVEVKMAELAATRETLLEAALAEFRKEQAWKQSILAAAT